MKIEMKSILDILPTFKDGKSFIYALMDGDECIYAGQTTNLKIRIYQHIGDGKEFTHVDYSVCDNELANDNEADLIVKFKPKFNNALPPTEKYISLARFKERLINEVTESEKFLDVLYCSGNSRRKNSQTYLSTAYGNRLIKNIINFIEEYEE